MGHPDHVSPPVAATRRRRGAPARAIFLAIVLSAAGVLVSNPSPPRTTGQPQQATSLSAGPTPTPAPGIQLRPTPDPTLAALATPVLHLPMPRNTAETLWCHREQWTVDDIVTAERIITWHDHDGAGYVTTWSLQVPASRFHPDMVARTLFDPALSRHRTYSAGQMPHHGQWPTTLSDDPQTLRTQLETIAPGIDTPAQLMRALATAHTRYRISHEVRAATLTLLATTSGITVRLGQMPTYTMDNARTLGLLVSARDMSATVTFQMDPTTSYLHAAIDHSRRRVGGTRRPSTYLVYLGCEQRPPTPADH